MTRCYAVVFLVMLASSSYSQSPATILAENLGIDSLVSELLSSPELQEAVDLSPSQLAKLKASVSSIDYGRIRREVDTLSRSGFGDRLMELEKSSRKLFAEALTDSQLAALRQLFVEQRFASQFKAVVSARFVVNYCDVSDDLDDFRRAIDAVVNQHAPTIQLLQQTRIQGLLTMVPQDSQIRLAQLVGDKYYPRDVVSHDIDAKDVPFPSNFRSVLMIEYLLDQNGLVALVNLTDAQRQELQKLRSESEMDLESVSQINDPKRFKQGLDELNARNLGRSTRLMGLLDNRCKLAVGRFVVQHRLESDPASVLLDNRMKEYLEMSGESWDQFVNSVDRHRVSIREELNKISRHMLDSLAEKVGQERGKRLRYLFSGVW